MIEWQNKEWRIGYGGRVNHFVIGTTLTQTMYRYHFACGAYSDFVRDDYENTSKPRCKKCEAAQHNAHLTPESLATSQAVVNASALEQSDGDTPPAQAQVA